MPARRAGGPRRRALALPPPPPPPARPAPTASRGALPEVNDRRVFAWSATAAGRGVMLEQLETGTNFTLVTLVVTVHGDEMVRGVRGLSITDRSGADLIGGKVVEARVLEAGE